VSIPRWHEAAPDALAGGHSFDVTVWAPHLGIHLDPISSQDACAVLLDHAIYDDTSGLVNDMNEGVRLAKSLVPNKAAILAKPRLLTGATPSPRLFWWFITIELLHVKYSWAPRWAANAKKLILTTWRPDSGGSSALLWPYGSRRDRWFDQILGSARPSPVSPHFRCLR